MAGAPAAGAASRTLGLRARLVLLVVSLLLPALALAATLIWDSSRQAYRFQERQLVATATTLSILIDRQLREQTARLNALAASDRLQEGDWAGFDRQARQALDGGESWVAVRDMGGQQLVNTLPPAGSALPRVIRPRVPPNQPPRADGVRVSNLATGTLAKAPVVIVVKAVRLRDGREVDLSIVTRADVFSVLLHRQRLPKSWTAAILDGEHRVISRTRDEARFRGSLATPVLRRHLAPGASGLIWGISLEGDRTRTAFQPVDQTAWTVVVSVTKRELQAPAVRAVGVGSLMALLLLLAGVASAVQAAGVISGGVERLRLATAPGAGGLFAAPQPSGVKEIDDLARAFEEAGEGIRARDAQQRLLINELNHRVKNTLATLQSVANASRRSAGTLDEFHAAMEGRIMAMSAAHELLTRTAWADTGLEELARSALQPFAGPRLTIEGPPVRVGPTDALNLSLIFYELATNALKYGALSGAAGRVRLSWTQADGVVRISWIESGGPAVAEPTRQGFGTRLLQKARESLQPSELTFAPEGLRCTLTLRRITPGGADGPVAP